MDVAVNFDVSEVKDCLSADLLKPNGNVQFHFDDIAPQAVGVASTCSGKAVPLLCPMTPNPRREAGNSVTPSTDPLSLGSGDIVDSSLEESLRTPPEDVFDPFAPGPDELLRAPFCKKFVKGCRRIVAQRLDFDHLDDLLGGGHKDQDQDMDTDMDSDTVSEKMILETIYDTLLEAIVLKQTEDFLAENRAPELESPCTPTSPPRLTGIADTCPGAPLKSVASKARKINPELCRKLEY